MFDSIRYFNTVLDDMAIPAKVEQPRIVLPDLQVQNLRQAHPSAVSLDE
jgi:hypothetical protein